MISMLLLLCAALMPCMAYPIPPARDFVQNDMEEEYTSPDSIFDLSDAQVPMKSPETHSAAINYLRALGLKIVMAYYDFTTWISIQSASLLTALKDLFGSSHQIAEISVPASAGDSHGCCA